MGRCPRRSVSDTDDGGKADSHPTDALGGEPVLRLLRPFAALSGKDLPHGPVGG